VLDAVGDEIETGILGGRNALFLARETWNDWWQLLYRVHEPDIAAAFLQALIARSDQRREWEFQMDHDASWASVRPLCFMFVAHATTQMHREMRELRQRIIELEEQRTS